MILHSDYSPRANGFIPIKESKQEIRIDASGGENNINSISGSICRQLPGRALHQKLGKFMST